MNFRAFLVALLFFDLSINITGQFINKLITESPTLIQFKDVNCTQTVWELQVQDEGLGVSIISNRTVLNASNSEYLAVSADSSMGGKNASVFYVTGQTQDVWLAVPLAQKVYLKFSTSENCSEKIDFLVTVKQYDRAIPEPAPTEPNPNPPQEFQTSIMIYLAGKHLDQFLNVEFLDSFKSYVHEAAYNFSDSKNLTGIDYTKQPNETVFLTNIQTCSKKWDEFETCVQAQMSVYITPPKASYQLTVANLQKLWDILTHQGFPPTLGVQPYRFSDSAITWWILFLVIVVVITLVLGYLYTRLQRGALEVQMFLKEEEERRRREEILSQVPLRRETIKLQLSKHQKIPEFMLNNADNVSVSSDQPPVPTLKPILKTADDTVSDIPPVSPIQSPSAVVDRPMFFSYNNMSYLEEDEEEVANFQM